MFEKFYTSRCSGCNNQLCSQNSNPKSIKVVLIGNPNVGKSSLFNTLSNKYVDVSNYSGTTVSISRTKTSFGELVDTPGIYTLYNCSDDEKITKKFIYNADIIINVINSTTIERDLLLTLQLIAMQRKMLIVLNQTDEATKNGIFIDENKLSSILNTKVIKTTAKTKQGVSNIIVSIENGGVLIPNITLEEKKHYIPENIYDCLETNTTQAYQSELQLIQNITSNIILKKNKPPKLDHILSDALFHPMIGWPIAIFIFYVLFKVLGTFVSGQVVDQLVLTCNSSYIPFISEVFTKLFSGNMLEHICVGEFGILTMSVEIIFCILIPLITGYYIIMSLLEDSGYLPRLAVLTDTMFSKIGLNGRAIIPILLGFGCGAMGTISSRILASQKERAIVTAIIGIAIPCAAQQGIIVSLISSTNNILIWWIYIVVMMCIIGISGKVLNQFFGGSECDLLIDIPPLRIPSIRNCIKKTFFRVMSFIKESVPIFMLSSVIITLLNECGFLMLLQNSLKPLVEYLLHLPKEFADIFVMGIIRRDLASVGVLNMSTGTNAMLSHSQILVASVVITLFVPCINALMVICKERGLKAAILLWLGTLIISITVGSILAFILNFIRL